VAARSDDRRRASWRDRFPEEVTCVRCLEVVERDDVDRLLWCEPCQAAARRRAGRWGWIAGGVAGAALALWIWRVIEPASDLIIGGWIAVVVGGAWITARMVREIGYGIERFRNRRAREAVPPASPVREAEGGTESEGDEV